MCNVSVLKEAVGKALDPAGITRPGSTENRIFDPAGITRGGKGEDPLGISEAWKDLTGRQQRLAMEEQQKKADAAAAAAAAKEANLEAQQSREAKEKALALARASLGGGRGRASTLLTGPRGLLSGGYAATRSLLPV